MNQRCSYLLLGCLLLLTFIANAQESCSYELTLQFVEQHTLEPIHPAVVYIEELKLSLNTDEKGVVVFKNLCEKEYTLHLHSFGYAAFEQKINVHQKTSLTFKIKHDTENLNEVVIKEERHAKLIQSSEQLHADEISAQSGKTITQLLQQINGVNALGNGATISKPIIHGMHSNRIATLNNGIKQEDQQWGAEHAPNIDPFSAGKITLVKGAAGVQYGTDALAGVILIEPQEISSEPGWNGALHLAAASNNRMGVAALRMDHNFEHIKGLSMRFQGSLKQAGNYRIPNHWVDNTGMKEANFSSTLSYKRVHFNAEIFYSHFQTELGIYTGSHTGNQQDLWLAINSPKPLIEANFSYDIKRPKQMVFHDLFKSKITVENRLGIWQLTYGMQQNFRQEFDLTRVSTDKAQLNLTLTTHSLNLNLATKEWKNWTTQIGIDGQYQNNAFANGDRLFIPLYQSFSGAFYGIEKWRKNNWQLETGVRYDLKQFDVTNFEGNDQHKVKYTPIFHNVSATLGGQYHFPSGWEFSTTLSRAWRAPQANELYSSGFHQGAARIEYGNKQLKPEQSNGINVNVNYEWGNKFQLQTTLYSQWIQDFIYLEPGADLLTIRGYFKTFQYQQTNAWLNGLDCSLGYEWNQHWRSQAKVSILRARNVSQNDWLILMPCDRASWSTRYSHSFRQAMQNVFAEFQIQFVARQTRIPKNFDQIDFPRPPADFTLCNGSAGFTTMVHHQPIDLQLEINNIFNVSYRDYLDAFRYFINQPGTNFTFRLKIPFQFNQFKKNQNEKDILI